MCLSKSGHHTNSIDDSTGIVVSQFTSYGQSALLLLFLSREPGNGYMHDALPSLLRGCIGYLSSGIWLPSNSGVKWGGKQSSSWPSLSSWEEKDFMGSQRVKYN